jgi:hypothetical protein
VELSQAWGMKVYQTCGWFTVKWVKYKTVLIYASHEDGMIVCCFSLKLWSISASDYNFLNDLLKYNSHSK